MKSQQELNYNRIADAIRFIKKNYRTQPKLEEIAEHINMSPFHFQRMFSEWAGTTPKRFLQYLNIEYAKKILKKDVKSGIIDLIKNRKGDQFEPEI